MSREAAFRCHEAGHSLAWFEKGIDFQKVYFGDDADSNIEIGKSIEYDVETSGVWCYTDQTKVADYADFENRVDYAI